jgi:hypothetical protein
MGLDYFYSFFTCSRKTRRPLYIELAYHNIEKTCRLYLSLSKAALSVCGFFQSLFCKDFLYLSIILPVPGVFNKFGR